MSNIPTVLVVDDDAAIRRAMKVILEKRFQIVLSADGPQAIKFVSDHPGNVSIAFVDYAMPEMNGDLVCAALRSLDATISIIGFSGNDDASFSDQLFAKLLKKNISCEHVLDLTVRAAFAAEQQKRANCCVRSR